ncbi:MAG TPA: hypothetical protein PKG93_00320 [Bacilli bacterium]|jgi:hypothetical protein|nr:hypothetical protein [Bacilli bacterium]
MKKMTILMAIFAFVSVGLLTAIGLDTKYSLKAYHTLENDLVESAQMYIETNKLTVMTGESTQVSVDTMLNDGLLSSNSVNGDNCNGYVVIKHDLNGYDYLPYIKCNKYETN